MQRQAWAFIWGVGESEGVLESPVFVAGGRRGRLAGGASAGPPKELLATRKAQKADNSFHGKHIRYGYGGEQFLPVARP